MYVRRTFVEWNHGGVCERKTNLIVVRSTLNLKAT